MDFSNAGHLRVIFMPLFPDRGEPFRVFRSYEGNFYAAIVYSVNKLLKGEDQPSDDVQDPSSASVIQDLLTPSDSAGSDSR